MAGSIPGGQGGVQFVCLVVGGKPFLHFNAAAAELGKITDKVRV